MSELIKIYQDEITQQGIKELRDRYPANVVYDMSDEEQFKEARKTRTERNKLVEAINRRRIDTANEIKTIGDSLIGDINGIYEVVVKPFEIEDQRRKDEAEAKARVEREAVEKSQREIDKLNGFTVSCLNANSESISSAIDAVTNVDPSMFHKDLLHEALETKEYVLEKLTSMLSSKLELEATEKENAELRAKLAAMEAAEKANAEALASATKENVKAVKSTKEANNEFGNHGVHELHVRIKCHEDDVGGIVESILAITGVSSVS